ncbi:hypothetical protein BDP55DRAFT_194449 [Colletotrichum godetiae]|uniref:Uncharacterized protein n=1 Tax=Colletotrichum godetiae TaxID=1209918 RepID=A0AAJ0EU38_9PEZI|nr:uncharacterized protein BDP55DRAFT_194449 [Colletotrichum godetiae]KAK1673943.1 hypothetical protein BDP55DRAFT_194449 [Colletotrichum godetiae]
MLQGGKEEDGIIRQGHEVQQRNLGLVVSRFGSCSKGDGKGIDVDSQYMRDTKNDDGSRWCVCGISWVQLFKIASLHFPIVTQPTHPRPSNYIMLPGRTGYTSDAISKANSPNSLRLFERRSLSNLALCWKVPPRPSGMMHLGAMTAKLGRTCMGGEERMDDFYRTIESKQPRGSSRHFKTTASYPYFRYLTLHSTDAVLRSLSPTLTMRIAGRGFTGWFSWLMQPG